eukprot:TRINITY_DN24997_c0_g1_i1.p1 TRINITY_DN24997_c0_g1~~TRINITY_DN24997_c0_g1_i1.p1  ORF type:complete len:188 (+),score=80.92 TRINITY_DN24997_c0_g1_i1:91-654(+)
MKERLAKDALLAADDRFPSEAVLGMYAEVPTVHRNRLHYPVLKQLPGVTTLQFLQYILQSFSGCCTVAELSSCFPGGCHAAVFHFALVCHRDLWLEVLVRSLADCRGIIALRQDAVDALTLAFPLPQAPKPKRSVHASENMWRSALHYSHEKEKAPKEDAVWLHWEVVRSRYHSWWLDQCVAGDGEL